MQWPQYNCELQLRHWKEGREDEKDRGEQEGKESVWARSVQIKTFFPFLISTQSVEFWYTDFHTALYFVNQRNYKHTMPAHAFTCTSNFYSQNVITSH
jgi:hypothetical protein